MREGEGKGEGGEGKREGGERGEGKEARGRDGRRGKEEGRGRRDGVCNQRKNEKSAPMTMTLEPFKISS